LGDAQYVIYAFPGEKTERALGLELSQASEFDVTVIEGADILTVIQRPNGYSIAVDSTALAAGVGRTYRLAIRNRSTGVAAEVLGPVRVIEPTVLGSGLVTSAGGAVTSNDGSLRLEFDAQPNAVNLNVTLLLFTQPSGSKQFRIKFDHDIGGDTRGVRIVQAPSVTSATARALSSTAKSTLSAAGDSYPGFVDWIRVRRQFTLFGGFRLREGPIALSDLRFSCGADARIQLLLGLVCLQDFDAWALTGRVARSAIPAIPADRGEPVLLVHGYTSPPLFGP